MTQEEAKIILGITEEDEAADRYEDEIFKLVQLFFKDPVIPNLAEGRKKKIGQLSEAMQFFSLEIVKPSEKISLEIKDLDSEKDWRHFFQKYERNKAMIRREISNTYLAAYLMLLIDLLVKNEIQYAGILIRYTSNIPDDENAKVSEAVDWPEMMKECENLQTKGILKSALQSFENITENLSIFNLSKEVNRLRKLVKNG